MKENGKKRTKQKVGLNGRKNALLRAWCTINTFLNRSVFVFICASYSKPASETDRDKDEMRQSYFLRFSYFLFFLQPKSV